MYSDKQLLLFSYKKTDRNLSVFSYRHSTNVSSKHFIAQIQFKLMVKNDSVAIYGQLLLVSGLLVRTLKVAQQPSIFSIRKTIEQLLPASVQLIGSLVVGKDQTSPLQV